MDDRPSCEQVTHNLLLKDIPRMYDSEGPAVHRVQAGGISKECLMGNWQDVLTTRLRACNVSSLRPRKTTIAAYRHLDTFGWMQLKHRLLEFFQGRRVKVCKR